MNINDYPDKLLEQEQIALDTLISNMDKVLQKLDKRLRGYVSEAKNADIRVNPDLYLSRLLAQRGKKDTYENRLEILKSRDELYDLRLLLEVTDEGSSKSDIEEIKVGLHTCTYQDQQFVVSWTMPLCRHYILNRASPEFVSVVKEKHGREYHTKYNLLIKNRVELRFTNITKASNEYPVNLDQALLEKVRGTGFWKDSFLDELITGHLDEDLTNVEVEKVIFDQFLQELLARRQNTELRNIVFTIQKRQSEIIQAPFAKNMIIQGCAGSGKSMIMLHRLPIVLYDNPKTLNKANLYIISPSPMYIQMAENMRYELEISEIKMGTIKDYYDFCINKYPGYAPKNYGKIDSAIKLSSALEKYVYSQKCITDIKDCYERMLRESQIDISQECLLLNIDEHPLSKTSTALEKFQTIQYNLNQVIQAQERILADSFEKILEIRDSLYELKTTLDGRRLKVIENLTIKIQQNLNDKNDKQNEIKYGRNLTQDDIEELEIEIFYINDDIEKLTSKRDVAMNDSHFDLLNDFAKIIDTYIKSIPELKSQFSRNDTLNVYKAILAARKLKTKYNALYNDISKIDDEYSDCADSIIPKANKPLLALINIETLQNNCLDYTTYMKIKENQKRLSENMKEAVNKTYQTVLESLGVDTKRKTLIGLSCSPYLYLQAIYSYQGAPVGKRESLLAIDEAQGIAVEEMRLLKRVNGDRVIFNIYGDIHQHIEDTKGVDSWKEYASIFDYDYYDMQENYRNASQITEYCNRVFGMNMVAINTPGKGVHELLSKQQFEKEMITQLMDSQRVGVAAILVSNSAEARCLLDMFSFYDSKFHDMTGQDFTIHHTRWNIMTIDDAKGLEFSSVIVISGRMTLNQRYIAFTRALDDLYVYPELLDISGFEEQPVNDTRDKGQKKSNEGISGENKQLGEKKSKHEKKNEQKDYSTSELRQFFMDAGCDVVDKRGDGGRLWVVGEKEKIKNTINAAINKFKISGKYTKSNEIDGKNGWYTKSDK